MSSQIYRPPSKQATDFLWSKDGKTCIPRQGAFFIDFEAVDLASERYFTNHKRSRRPTNWDEYDPADAAYEQSEVWDHYGLGMGDFGGND